MKYFIKFVWQTISLAFALNPARVSAASIPSIDTLVQQSLKFIQQEQFAETSGYYQPGEWPVEMKSYLIPSMVGLGRLFARPSQEPTAFATASIMKLLSEAYLLDPKLGSVPSIIEKSIPSFQHYQFENVYFYYPLNNFKGLSLHVPSDPHYVPRAMMSLALVPPDADTTVVTYTALAYADQILKQLPISQYKIPESTLKILNQFRDINRKPHLYNRLNGNVKNSGAYMTWLMDENTGPSKTFFRSMNDSPKKGYRIVFGSNDVDCVVNANVLHLFSLTNHTSEGGYADSCELLNQSILQSRNLEPQLKYCGLYYPNFYGALHAISNVYKAGAQCLTKSRNRALDILIEGWQDNEGLWKNADGIGREDRVQSTAAALSALLNYIDPSDRRFETIVNRAVKFLISEAKKKDEDRLFWKGEVFFSAGPAARSAILWRSDSYTTALVLLTLVKAKHYLNGDTKT